MGNPEVSRGLSAAQRFFEAVKGLRGAIRNDLLEILVFPPVRPRINDATKSDTEIAVADLAYQPQVTVMLWGRPEQRTVLVSWTINIDGVATKHGGQGAQEGWKITEREDEQKQIKLSASRTYYWPR